MPDLYAATVIADSPALYLRQDELSGTAAADSSGNGLASDQTPPEEWRPIPGFSLYDASSRGRIRSWAKGGRRAWISPAIRALHENGVYLAVTLVQDVGGKRTMTVHRLVLLAFRGPAPNGHEGAHLNGNSRDNRPENLAWCTHAENVGHTKVHGTMFVPAPLHGTDNPAAKLTEVHVREIRDFVGSEPYSVLAARYGISKGMVGHIVRRRVWAHVA